LDEISEKINKISEEDYKIMLENVKNEARKISKGFYFSRSINEIEKKFNQ